jgi:hypothetical protein
VPCAGANRNKQTTRNSLAERLILCCNFFTNYSILESLPPKGDIAQLQDNGRTLYHKRCRLQSRRFHTRHDGNVDAGDLGQL